MPRYEQLEDEKWLREKYNEGHSQAEIAELVGCSQTAVSHRFKNYGIETTRYKQPELNDPEWLKEKHHDENLSLSAMGNILGCTRSAVGYAMRRNDLEVRQNSVVNEVEGGLSDKALSIIEGELLGDGCIPKPQGKAGATFSYGTSRWKYRDWLVEWFRGNGFECTKYGYEQDTERKGWTPNMTYRFNTKTYFCLKGLRDKWYPDGVKEVPQEFELDPLSLRHWYIGDGTAPQNGQMALYTDGFDIDSVNRLQEELRDKAGVDSSVSYRNSIIIGKEADRGRFFDYMAEPPEKVSEVYGYKWP